MPRDLHTIQRDLAHSMIRVYGNKTKGTLVKYAGKDQGRIGGQVTRRTLSRTALSMSMARFKERDIDGTDVRAYDRRIYVSAKDANTAGVVPAEGDEILADGKTWEILSVHSVKPSVDSTDTPFYYKCHCREP